ncbi:cytochrome c oxidase assembly protein COX16-domain-containing protein [Lipomyces japonicus]|uniref:cytochrome c oxidase assembly protein COX16-domain-containing protein n=1 Tax=Lipomyces japonicus TaxID=56871 RepID=UPI0034CFD5BD
MLLRQCIRHVPSRQVLLSLRRLNSVRSNPPPVPPPLHHDNAKNPDNKTAQPDSTETSKVNKHRKIIFEEDKRSEFEKILTKNYNKLAKFYKNLVRKQPFIFYGAPFMVLIVVGSYYLQELTEIRYKVYDSKVHQVTDGELERDLRFRQGRETREEYYDRNYKFLESVAKKDYEIKRIERRPGDAPERW